MHSELTQTPEAAERFLAEAEVGRRFRGSRARRYSSPAAIKESRGCIVDHARYHRRAAAANHGLEHPFRDHAAHTGAQMRGGRAAGRWVVARRRAVRFFRDSRSAGRAEPRQRPGSAHRFRSRALRCGARSGGAQSAGIGTAAAGASGCSRFCIETPRRSSIDSTYRRNGWSRSRGKSRSRPVASANADRARHQQRPEVERQQFAEHAGEARQQQHDE